MEETSLQNGQQTTLRESKFQPSGDQADRMRKLNLRSEQFDDDNQMQPDLLASHVPTDFITFIMCLAKIIIPTFAIISCVLLGFALSVDIGYCTFIILAIQILALPYYILEIVMKWCRSDKTHMMNVLYSCAFGQCTILLVAAYIFSDAVTKYEWTIILD